MVDWLADFWPALAIGGFLLALIGFVVYMAAFPGPQISLTRADWHCERSSTFFMTTWIMSGKVMVPIMTPITECVLWARNG
jgi:hypothetical protein